MNTTWLTQSRPGSLRRGRLKYALTYALDGKRVFQSKLIKDINCLLAVVADKKALSMIN